MLTANMRMCRNAEMVENRGDGGGMEIWGDEGREGRMGEGGRGSECMHYCLLDAQDSHLLRTTREWSMKNNSC